MSLSVSCLARLAHSSEPSPVSDRGFCGLSKLSSYHFIVACSGLDDEMGNNGDHIRILVKKLDFIGLFKWSLRHRVEGQATRFCYVRFVVLSRCGLVPGNHSIHWALLSYLVTPIISFNRILYNTLFLMTFFYKFCECNLYQRIKYCLIKKLYT